MPSRSRTLVSFAVVLSTSLLISCAGSGSGGGKDAAPDTTPPTALSGSPTGTGAAASSLVTVIFDEAMQDALFTTSTFTVNDGASNLEGSVSYDSATKAATFMPRYQLALDTTFTVTVTTGVADLAGNPLAAPFTFQFSTTATDTSPPNVVGWWFTSAALTFEVNEPIDDATAVLVVNDGAADVAGTVAWDAGTLTLTFTPGAPLAVGSTYTVTLQAGLEDLAGNPTAADRTWTRSLARPAMTGAPALLPAVVEAGKSIQVTVPVNPETGRVEVTLTDPTLGDAGFGEAVNTAGATSVVVTVATDLGLTGSYYPRIRVTDPSGLVGTEYSLDSVVSMTQYAATVISGDSLGATGFAIPFVTLALDTTPPTIVASSPEGTAVACGSPIRVTFDEPMEPSLFTDATVIVFDGEARVEGEIAYDAATATASFWPRRQLTPGGTYLVAVTTGVEDLSGNALARVHSWEFTAEASDTSPPAVWDVRVQRSAVTITFTENVDPSTISLTVTSGGDPVAVARTSYNSLSYSVLYQPTVVYPAIGETWVITLASGTKDLAGNAMSMESSWTHTFELAGITGTPIVPTGSVISGRSVVITVPITANVAQMAVYLYDAAGTLGGAVQSWVYPAYGAGTVDITVTTQVSANGAFYPRIALYDEIGEGAIYIFDPLFDPLTQQPSPNYFINPWNSGWTETGIAIPWLQLVVAPNLKVAISSVTSTGSEVRVAYTVTNSGNAAAGPFSVAAWADRATAPTVGSSGEGSASHASLGVGASASGTVTISSALLRGKAWAIVDTEGVVTEANETDNVSSSFAWSSPNLTVSLDGAIGSGSVVTVKFTVTNDGEAAAGPFVVGLWANRASAPALSDAPDTTATYASLAMGASVSGSVAVASALMSGTAWAVVDGAGAVTELNEGDNVSGGTSWPYANLKIRVSGTGFVSGACGPFSPLCTPTADRIGVAYEVSNVGTVAAGAFRVNVWSSRGGAPGVTDTVGSQSANVASLAAGAKATGTLYFTYSSAGTAWATVDGGLAVAESWETDNVSAGYGWFCREETAYCFPFDPFCDPTPFVCSE